EPPPTTTKRNKGEPDVQGAVTAGPVPERLAPRARPGLGLPGQRDQAAGYDRILRPVRGAVAQHREPDGLQARHFNRGSVAQRPGWPRRRIRAAAGRGRRGRRRERMTTREHCLYERSRKGDHALLIQTHAGGAAPENVLEEFADLARSAGASIAATLTARIDRPNPATLIGSGKLEEVKAAAEATGADLILANHQLTPVQARNLERALQRRVGARTGPLRDSC